MAELHDIDFIRAIFDKVLDDDGFNIASFYEQVVDEQDIKRYVERLQDIVNQQNKDKYKAIGVITQNGEADIMNIKGNYIVPLSFALNVDMSLNDRDDVIGKMKTLIDTLKGRSVELALLENSELIIFDKPISVNNDKFDIVNDSYVGVINQGTDMGVINTGDLFTLYFDELFDFDITRDYQLYCVFSDEPTILYQVKVGDYSSGEWTTFTKTKVDTLHGLYKVSLSFNNIQSEEPFSLNGDDRVWLSILGQATVVDNGVFLGNDIQVIEIKVPSFVNSNSTEYDGATAQEKKDYTDIGFSSDTAFRYWLNANMPDYTVKYARANRTGGGKVYSKLIISSYLVDTAELSSGVGVDDDSWQEWAKGFVTLTRIMSTANNLQYSFVYDTRNELFRDWFKYGRYGLNNNPDKYYEINEYVKSLDYNVINTIHAKLVDIKVQNTNSDVILLNVSFKVIP